MANNSDQWMNSGNENAKIKRQAVVLGFDDSEPIVQVSKLTRRQWAVLCPYCGGEHWHGRGGLDGSLYGSRGSHCYLGGYSATKPSYLLLEAAARMRAGRE